MPLTTPPTLSANRPNFETLTTFSASDAAFAAFAAFTAFAPIPKALNPPKPTPDNAVNPKLAAVFKLATSLH